MLAARRGALLLLWSCLGCGGHGGAATGARAGGQVPAGAIVLRRNAGPDLAILRRNSLGPEVPTLRLSLFVRAGSRAARPVELAALAAEVAARAAGPGARTRLTPTGLELELRCPQPQLSACLKRLARALSLRQVSATQLSQARRALEDRRRRAASADPQRTADHLAFRALLGDDAARGLDPLARPTDADAASAAQLEDFLARHFDPRRALLVAAGAIDGDELESAVTRAFAGLPAARGGAPEPEAADLEDRVRVEVGDGPAVSLALAAPDLATADALARALGRQLQTRLGAQVTSTHVFSLGAGGLALLRVRGDGPQPLVASAAQLLSTLRSEGAAPARDANAGAADVASAVRLVGQSWLSRGRDRDADAEPLQPRLGVGVVVAGGRADRPRLDDPDAERRDDWQGRLEAALAEGLGRAQPELQGEQDGAHAHVSLENGARIEVLRDSGPQLGLAIRFAGGAGQEPRALHGRSALLATLSALACAGHGPQALGIELERIGARLEPRVDAEGWGLDFSAPLAQRRQLLSLALDCALRPSLSPRHIARARLRLLSKLGARGGALGEQARAAAHLWPQAPGRMAAWGTPDAVAALPASSLRRALGQQQHGAALVIAATAAVPADQLAAEIARRVSQLPPSPGTDATFAERRPATRAKEKADAGTAMRAAPLQPTAALLHWQAVARPGGEAGAQAFAALIGAGLQRLEGLTVRWHGGGIEGDRAWAALSVHAPSERLLQLAEAAAPSAGALDKKALRAATERAHARHLERQVRRLDDSAARAALLASRLLGSGEPGPSSLPAAYQVALALAASQGQLQLLH